MIGRPFARLLRFTISMTIAMLFVSVAAYLHRSQKAEALAIREAHQKAMQQREDVIARLMLSAEKHAAQLATLDRRKAGITAVDIYRKTALETLRLDSTAVHDWAQHALPVNIVGMYARPALTGANDYLGEPMRVANEVLDASDKPAH